VEVDDYEGIVPKEPMPELERLRNDCKRRARLRLQNAALKVANANKQQKIIANRFALTLEGAAAQRARQALSEQQDRNQGLVAEVDSLKHAVAATRWGLATQTAVTQSTREELAQERALRQGLGARVDHLQKAVVVERLGRVAQISATQHAQQALVEEQARSQALAADVQQLKHGAAVGQWSLATQSAATQRANEALKAAHEREAFLAAKAQESQQRLAAQQWRHSAASSVTDRLHAQAIMDERARTEQERNRVQALKQEAESLKQQLEMADQAAEQNRKIFIKATLADRRLLSRTEFQKKTTTGVWPFVNARNNRKLILIDTMLDDWHAARKGGISQESLEGMRVALLALADACEDYIQEKVHKKNKSLVGSASERLAPVVALRDDARRLFDRLWPDLATYLPQ
jgi:hypothetical protein